MTIPPEISKRALARVISEFAEELGLRGMDVMDVVRTADSTIDEYSEEAIFNTIDSSDLPEDPDALMRRMRIIIRTYASPLRLRYDKDQIVNIVYSYAGYAMDMIKKLMKIGTSEDDQKLYDILDI